MKWYIRFEVNPEGNMKIKSFIAIVAVVIGTVSCSSCAKKIPDPVVVDASPVDAGQVDAGPVPVDAAPQPTTLTVTQNKWEFTLPSRSWKQLEEVPVNVTAYISEDENTMVVGSDEPFTGTFDEYALRGIRGARGAGATIESAKQVELNGHKFVLVESFKGDIRSWAWLTVVDGHGYCLSCGGVGGTSTKTICSDVANTYKIH